MYVDKLEWFDDFILYLFGESSKGLTLDDWDGGRLYLSRGGMEITVRLWDVEEEQFLRYTVFYHFGDETIEGVRGYYDLENGQKGARD